MLGLTASFAGGLVDTAIMRLMDVVLVFPSLLLAIVIVAILGPGLFNAMIAVAVVTLPSYTRLTRAAALSELARDYVTATRCAGAGTLHLMFNTVLPNCLAPLIVQASLGFATAILDAAALGFLGLGAQPPTPEWGTMLAGALQFYQRAWWVLAFPGFCDLAHRAGVQPVRRRAARCAGSQVEAVMVVASNKLPLPLAGGGWGRGPCHVGAAPSPHPLPQGEGLCSRSLSFLRPPSRRSP